MKTRFTTTNKLLKEGLEQSIEMVWGAKHRIIMDLWIGRIRTLLNSNCDEQLKTWNLATGGQYLLTGAKCSVQTGQKDFPVRKNGSTIYLFLLNGDDEGNFYIRKGFHLFFYRRKALGQMTDLAVLRPFVFLPRNVLVGHGYLHHTDADYLGTLRSLCHVHLSLGGFRPSIFYFVCVSIKPQNCQRRRSGGQTCVMRSFISFSYSTTRLAALHNVVIVFG